ncbi:hypothetical protein BaRGS_00017330 [Batillaria attramentaria]|uniref:guanylate cyclase n=1 Tax=Batillaria attramentaria TaxID=370345 RepID=A0ABD0KW15_9CAEN
MYGLLLESIQHYVQELYGESVWQDVVQQAGLGKDDTFFTHNQYNDKVMLRLATACSTVLHDQMPSADRSMHFFGTCFVGFCAHYGYDKILRVAGRNYRDFLHGIDNLHETIRFSYPCMQSPSFMVEQEDVGGCVLVYRSRRTGFSHYVMGQLQQCASILYKVHVNISILDLTETDGGCSVRYRLDFNNCGYTPPLAAAPQNPVPNALCPIRASALFKIFPFCILFGRDMIVRHVGHSAQSLFRDRPLVNTSLTAIFSLRRPLLDFTWHNIRTHQNVVYELEARPPTRQHSSDGDRRHSEAGGQSGRKLLRGQMKWIEELDCIAFLCTPLVGSLQELEEQGLYLNDLNMYDSSREMVNAGWQHASILEMHMDKKSQQIVENMKALDKARTESNKLLYSMLPETIADSLRDGQNPLNTCQTFDAVTILFSYLVGFQEICNKGSAMDVVTVINNSFLVFDPIVDKYGLFKVETLGDAVYMVAGGVPEVTTDHAERVAYLALDFVREAHKVTCPIEGKSLNVRIGMHTGSIVAGIVGKCTPQYCLFGDTVNTASRMQTHSLAGRIHLSEPCHERLKGTDFITIYRGRVNAKVGVCFTFTLFFAITTTHHL